MWKYFLLSNIRLRKNKSDVNTKEISHACSGSIFGMLVNKPYLFLCFYTDTIRDIFCQVIIIENFQFNNSEAATENSHSFQCQKYRNVCNFEVFCCWCCVNMFCDFCMNLNCLPTWDQTLILISFAQRECQHKCHSNQFHSILFVTSWLQIEFSAQGQWFKCLCQRFMKASIRIKAVFNDLMGVKGFDGWD